MNKTKYWRKKREEKYDISSLYESVSESYLGVRLQTVGFTAVHFSLIVNVRSLTTKMEVSTR
jgi:hypothetical protein